jgi:hypothetical protein
MNDDTTSLVEVVLEGGPTDMSHADRRRQASPGDERIKVRHGGGYEHFERTDERAADGGGSHPVIYRWVTRTRVAE